MDPVGVYVHVPFCVRRCDYCDFATWTDRAHLVDDYLAACVADLRARMRRHGPATTVFVGGGTPSLLSPDQLSRVLDAVDRTTDAEITVECNPDGVDVAKLVGYREAGVNRLSFGVQSLRPHVLRSLGRSHDPDAVYRAIGAAGDAGFTSWNLDLIYGAAGESVDDWRWTLDAALALDPPHVSAYALGVEPGTPLGRRVAAGAVAGPDDDDLAARYCIADEVLAAAGLAWYEVSNWARPGFACRHNLDTWAQREYVGIGCAAHGHTDGERWWNVRTPERYMARIAAGASPVGGRIRLDPATQAEEGFDLALRTASGVTVADAAAPAVAALEASGHLERRADRVVLTRAGRLLADDVAARLVLAGGVRVPLALGTMECQRPGTVPGVAEVHRSR